MSWPRNRSLLMVLSLALALAVGLGCTTREDPGETLVLSGNHSAGDLVMVTTDTSSDGFHYLNPRLSPDGTRILFTADWKAFPSERDEGEAIYTNFRQMILIPLQAGIEPANTLEEQGAELIRVGEINLVIGGLDDYMGPDRTLNGRKGHPIWQDDSTVIFWLKTAAGNRLFRCDITDPSLAPVEILYLEPTDGRPSPPSRQHMEPALSPDGRWLAFTRSGCSIPDSFETCTMMTLMVLDMATAGQNDGYGAVAFPVTSDYSRIEAPAWHPTEPRLIFAGGMDVGGDTGLGTELYTVDFDTTGLAEGTMVLDKDLQRLTFTAPAPGDPLGGIVNTSPAYSVDGSAVFYVSTRRAPSTTLHDRNIWRMPADGSTEPAMYYFTRSDDQDPTIMPDGRLLMSSALGFPTEMLVRLEEEAYQRIAQENQDQDLGLDEVQMRELAAEQRQNLEFFEGVMFHLYTFRP